MASSNDSFVDMTGCDGTMMQKELCLKFPAKVSSTGLAVLYCTKIKLKEFMNYSGPRLHLQMVASFVLTQLIHNMVLKYLGFPMLISQILARTCAALVSDLLSMALLNIGKYFNSYTMNTNEKLLKEIGLNIAFVLIVFYVLRPGMNWMVRRTPNGGKIKDVFVYAVIFMLMIIPTVTEMTHLFVLVGPFMLGLAIPDGPPLGSALVEKLEPFVSGLLLPFFASACGMRFNIYDIINISPYAKSQSIASVVTLFVKFLVSLALPLLCKMPTSDSLALALIMIAKGLFEIGSYSILFDVGMISADIFSTNFVIIVLLASVTPMLVKKFYDPSRKYIGYQKRSILHAKLNENLRIMGCIHVPSNVNSIINLLDSLCLTKESPITLDVLHLVKLTGRATPLLIAHSKNSKTMPTKSYSENVILAFNQFERDNWGALSVNIFIAISPPNLMYEDVCNLAMKQLTTFIILPFHRRWYIDGSIESEDASIRNLNCQMLERAPCSLGILVEGRQTTKCSNSNNSIEISSSLTSLDKIVVIFLGGKDDREALALAKRMSQDQEVNITVIHLKDANSYGATLVDSEKMLDDETLRFMKQTTYITYIEQYVNEGTETSNYLKSIVDDFQLIIVGRRYKKEDSRTSGLEE
ncbi:Cation/H+ exchanger [Corchorus capsularis]|uniref:Cation/H+ exchanger n=1 Tax=Corchorus capsularis TaxID=210143 RepID=A0A1R3G4S8_COCAP|nr:Cation/H+ exchanger [Corchorus capsularis]